MTPTIRSWVERCAPYLPAGDVLEVGSQWVEGGGGRSLADLRPLFRGRSYIGSDLRPGPGVDLVADCEHLPLPDGQFAVVLCLDTIEHVRRPWVAYREMWRVLRPGGMLLTSTVFWCGVHSHPSDYWRCTCEGMAVWLEAFSAVWVGSDTSTESPRIVVGAGVRGDGNVPDEVREGWVY